MLEAAKYPHPDADCNGRDDGAEDGDPGAVWEVVEMLGYALGWWGGQDLQGGGVAGDDLDGLRGSGRVAVFVFAAGGVVGHADGLHEHCVGGFGVVYFSAGPLDGVVVVVFVAAGPDADADVHGCLWVVCPSVCVVVRQRTYDGAVDVPFQRLIRPAGGIVVVALGRVPVVGQRVPFCPFDGVGGVAFSVVVALGVGVVVADEFLVYFIQIVGLQYDAADYALAWGSFQPDLDFAEEYVELGLDGGGVAFLGDGEGSTGGVVG